jgi:hypothetical protein
LGRCHCHSAYINPGAEISNLTGWTTEVGAFISQGSNLSYEGSRRFKTSSGDEAIIYQDVEVPFGTESDIDAALYAADLVWHQKSVSETDDPGAAVLELLDDNSAPLADPFVSPMIGTGNSGWTERELYAEAPAGTRQIRIKLWGVKEAGSGFDAYSMA